ncbi:AMP-binding protein [Microbacterium trichothecenolyticum]|uniref:AMP-binding protein n=1 Tax=Microbacterium trichothecenolyticum TaxID=69370 RepID=UPI001C6E3CC8|nr:AMP-binding protein [Microbacterium trichothecenolyticum]MBW9122329.1 AMP-binding protein [Microbacterium trichothecenolyticum]
MHPFLIAENHPDRAAAIDGDTGSRLTYGQLTDESLRWAHALREAGISAGSRVALMLPNSLNLFPVVWALQSTGVEYTPINTHLTAGEIERIVVHSGATALISSIDLLETLDQISDAGWSAVWCRFLVDGDAPDWRSWPRERTDWAPVPIPHPNEGMFLYYSSGTTGAPKGILRGELVTRELGETPDTLTQKFLELVDFHDGDVLLSSAPLYHSAPLGWVVGAQRLGGTVLFTRKFDAKRTLELIDEYDVTHCQMVPTMFVRLLKLPESERRGSDRASLRHIVHSAAPCPVEVKRAMIEEWGPIIDEYYTSTELIGATFITSAEWLQHPGSVGRALEGWGEPRIIDEEMNLLPARETGELWFEGTFPFTYFGDTTALKSQRDDTRGWATAGDVGWIDEEGYLYLTDRKTYMIVSGGVNIYPQEIEAALILHPAVADVAVFGVPNPDFGEEVKAVIQPAGGVEPGPELAALLEAHCRQELAGFKVPRSFDFLDELPRLDTGKLYKAALRDPYWKQSA